MFNFLKKIISNWLFSYDYELIIMEGGKVPWRVYKNDAGYDLYVSRSTTIKSGEMTNIPTGVSVRCKRPAWIFLTGRSSTLIRHGIMVNTGIIDGDYTGELFIKAFNPTKQTVYIPPNTRIGQIIVLPHTVLNFKQVEKFSSIKGRGMHGFGSSGH